MVYNFVTVCFSDSFLPQKFIWVSYYRVFQIVVVCVRVCVCVLCVCEGGGGGGGGGRGGGGLWETLLGGTWGKVISTI